MVTLRSQPKALCATGFFFSRAALYAVIPPSVGRLKSSSSQRRTSKPNGLRYNMTGDTPYQDSPTQPLPCCLWHSEDNRWRLLPSKSKAIAGVCFPGHPRAITSACCPWHSEGNRWHIRVSPDMLMYYCSHFQWQSLRPAFVTHISQLEKGEKTKNTTMEIYGYILLTA